MNATERPSGEYEGILSRVGPVEIARSCPPAAGVAKMSPPATNEMFELEGEAANSSAVDAKVNVCVCSRGSERGLSARRSVAPASTENFHQLGITFESDRRPVAADRRIEDEDVGLE